MPINRAKSILMIGIGDMDRRFNPDGIAICSNETTNAFMFIFKAISDGVEKLFNISLEKGMCTCPQFLERFMCKHVLGIAIRLKFTKPPPEAENVPIGRKRKRGRPKKATKALIID